MFEKYAVIFIFFNAFIVLFSKFNNNKLVEKVLILMLLLIASITLILRDPMSSNDSVNYSLMYSLSGGFIDALSMYHKNYFFSFTMFLGNLFELSYTSYEIFLSLFMLSLVFYAVYKMFGEICGMSSLVLSFFIISSTFILLFTNVIRQGLALSFIFLALYFYQNNKWLKLLFALTFSFLSHTSAVFFFVVFPAAYFIEKKVSSKYIFHLILLTPFLAIVGKILSYSLPDFYGFDRVVEMSGEDYGIKVLIVKYFLLYSTILITWLLVLKNEIEVNLYVKKIIFILIVLFAIVSFFSFSPLFASRLLYYISAMVTFLLAYVFYTNDKNMYLNALVLFLCVLLYSFFVLSYESTASQLGLYLRDIF